MLQLDNHEIVGRKGVLLQLLPYKEDISANQYGVLTPSYSEYETDIITWVSQKSVVHILIIQDII